MPAAVPVMMLRGAVWQRSPFIRGWSRVRIPSERRHHMPSPGVATWWEPRAGPGGDPATQEGKGPTRGHPPLVLLFVWHQGAGTTLDPGAQRTRGRLQARPGGMYTPP